MNKTYILITFSHRTFNGTSLKTAIVGLQYKDNTNYLEMAKEKIRKKFNLRRKRIEIINISYLGSNVYFMPIEENPDKQTIDMEELYQKVITNIFGEDIVFDVTEYNKICDIIDNTVKTLQER